MLKPSCGKLIVRSLVAQFRHGAGTRQQGAAGDSTGSAAADRSRRQSPHCHTESKVGADAGADQGGRQAARPHSGARSHPCAEGAAARRAGQQPAAAAGSASGQLLPRRPRAWCCTPAQRRPPPLIPPAPSPQPSASAARSAASPQPPAQLHCRPQPPPAMHPQGAFVYTAPATAVFIGDRLLLICAADQVPPLEPTLPPCSRPTLPAAPAALAPWWHAPEDNMQQQIWRHSPSHTTIPPLNVNIAKTFLALGTSPSAMEFRLGSCREFC